MTLRVEDLAVARGGVPILSGLSFSLHPGTALALRGPNGAGKTTLLRTLAGLQPPLAGQIHGAGEAIAYAGHADGLKAMLSVTENLTFWAEVFGTSDIAPAMDAYDLHGLADRPAGTLSAGQKRRLGLARLLVTGRAIWALDEPTVSLDTQARRLFADSLSAHLQQGGSAVVATHIDVGLTLEELDLARYRAAPDLRAGASDEAFL